MGRMEVLNRAYVLLKHASGPVGSRGLARQVWRAHLAFTAIKCLMHLLRCSRGEDRARLAGAIQGHRAACRLRRTMA